MPPPTFGGNLNIIILVIMSRENYLFFVYVKYRIRTVLSLYFIILVKNLKASSVLCE
jgi:hypothetical protein